MHYGITLWAYLSEPLIKGSQTSKFNEKATIPHAQVTWSHITITYVLQRGIRKHCTWRKWLYLLEVSTGTASSYTMRWPQKKKAHLDFWQSLVESLATEYLQQQESCRSSIGRPLSWLRPVRLDRKLHLLEHGESRRDCVVCSDRSTG